MRRNDNIWLSMLGVGGHSHQKQIQGYKGPRYLVVGFVHWCLFFMLLLAFSTKLIISPASSYV